MHEKLIKEKNPNQKVIFNNLQAYTKTFVRKKTTFRIKSSTD